MLFKYTSKQHFVLMLLTITIASCSPIFEDSPLTLLKEVYNHKKTKKAILFMRFGNATTDNSLQVIVENPDFELTDTELGNTFIVDSNHNAVELDSTAIKFIWLNEETLQILYNSKLRGFKKETKVNEVGIVYKEQIK